MPYTYVKTYPTKKEFFCRLQDDYIFLQSAYLFGVDNTPVYYENIDKEVKEEWKRFMKAYPDSPTVPFIKDMLRMKSQEDRDAIMQKLTKFQESSDYPLLKPCPGKIRAYSE